MAFFVETWRFAKVESRDAELKLKEESRKQRRCAKAESRKQRPRLSEMFPAGAVCVGGSSCVVKFFLNCLWVSIKLLTFAKKRRRNGYDE